MRETHIMATLTFMNSVIRRGTWWKKAGVKVAWPAEIRARSAPLAKIDSQWMTSRTSGASTVRALAAMGSSVVMVMLV